MAAKAKKKSFFQMTPSERDADVKRFDRGLSLDELQPLSQKNRLLWEVAKLPSRTPETWYRRHKSSCDLGTGVARTGGQLCENSSSQEITIDFTGIEERNQAGVLKL